MRLWTIQHPAALERARRNGALRGDGRRLCLGPQFRRPYRWLIGEMLKRVPGYTGRYPVWAWPKKQDLRGVGYVPRGEKAVMIECEVPGERVLLSDFGAWHMVLNGSYLALTEAEDDEWDRAWGKQLREYDYWERVGRRKGEPEPADIPHEQRLRLERSWERIFDFKVLRRSKWAGGARLEPQATLEEVLVPDEVVSVREFIGR